MRKYQQIWEKLKALSPDAASSVGISISANPILHARIIKAVTKEKYRDLAYKLQLDSRTATMTSHVSGQVVTFKLQISFISGDF